MAETQEITATPDAPTVPPSQTRAYTALAVIPWAMAAVTATLWAMALTIAFRVQPATDPDVALSTLAAVTGIALWSTLFIGGGLLAGRFRAGLLASGIASGILLFGVTTCYLGGHTGSWLAVQGVLAIGLGAYSISALHITR